MGLPASRFRLVAPGVGIIFLPPIFLLSFEVFPGNRNDVTAVEEIVRLMEEKYGQAERVWVMDRGMVSEKNIAFLRQRGARYLVGTPKAQLRDFEGLLLEKEGWSEVRSGLEARLIAHPDGKGEEQYVLCRRSARADKERAMLARQSERLCSELIKSDLKLRPIYHQKTERVEAHILVCFLALVQWRVLEQWMHGKGLGTCARKLVAEISTIKSMDVVLPVKRGETRAELTMELGLVFGPGFPALE